MMDPRHRADLQHLQLPPKTLAGANLQAVDGRLAVPARSHRAHGGLQREQQTKDELLLLCARAAV